MDDQDFDIKADVNVTSDVGAGENYRSMYAEIPWRDVLSDRLAMPIELRILIIPADQEGYFLNCNSRQEVLNAIEDFSKDMDPGVKNEIEVWLKRVMSLETKAATIAAANWRIIFWDVPSYGLLPPKPPEVEISPET